MDTNEIQTTPNKDSALNFIKTIDQVEGHWWSESIEELADAMVAFAKLWAEKKTVYVVVIIAM